MIELVHLLGLVGVTLIVTRGAIFARVRRLVKFLSCPQCVGFHAGFWATGIATGVAAPTPTWSSAFSGLWHAALVGGAVSLLASIAEAALAALDEVVLKLQGKVPS
jgi:hypothetical protein